MTDIKEYKGFSGRGIMRDQLVICKALAYAIIIIERQPFAFRETSDMEDMKLALEYYSLSFLGVTHFMEEARQHIDRIDPRD